MNIPNANRYQTQRTRPQTRHFTPANGQWDRPARPVHTPNEDSGSGSVWGWIAAAIGVIAVLKAGAWIIAHPIITMALGSLAVLALI